MEKSRLNKKNIKDGINKICFKSKKQIILVNFMLTYFHEKRLLKVVISSYVVRLMIPILSCS